MAFDHNLNISESRDAKEEERKKKNGDLSKKKSLTLWQFYRSQNIVI